MQHSPSSAKTTSTLGPDLLFVHVHGLQTLLVSFRDGPNTTTTQKSFASDATSKRHLRTHQMKNLYVFSVFHCVEGCRRGTWCVIRGTPKMKNGAPRDELKNGRGRVWVVPYSCPKSPLSTRLASKSSKTFLLVVPIEVHLPEHDPSIHKSYTLMCVL